MFSGQGPDEQNEASAPKFVSHASVQLPDVPLVVSRNELPEVGAEQPGVTNVQAPANSISFRVLLTVGSITRA